MSTAPKLEDDSWRKMTPTEYLAWERQQPEKHEYSDGQVYAQSGASLSHNRIARNVAGELYKRLDAERCEAFSSDLRLWVESCEKFYYPDVMALCGEPKMLDNEFDTLCNPGLIVEVFSRSTRGVDEIQKRRHYRTIPTLGEYLLVDQYAIGVERLRRVDDEHWDSVSFDSLDQTIELTSVGCELSMARIYRQVKFKNNRTAQDPGSNQES